MGPRKRALKGLQGQAIYFHPKVNKRWATRVFIGNCSKTKWKQLKITMLNFISLYVALYYIYYIYYISLYIYIYIYNILYIIYYIFYYMDYIKTNTKRVFPSESLKQLWKTNVCYWFTSIFIRLGKHFFM